MGHVIFKDREFTIGESKQKNDATRLIKLEITSLISVIII